MEFLKKLTNVIAPSGNENTVRDIIIEEVKPFADEINVDTLGNLIIRKKGNGKKIMLSAHMDEVGIIATVIDDKGFVRFSNIGAVNKKALQYSKVKFANSTVGVVAEEPTESTDKSTNSNKMYVDLIYDCKVDSLNTISIGDVATFAPNFDMSGDILSSKALDDRAGCYILVETLKAISKTENDLYFVFTVQEELGLRGAKTSAYSIQPHYAISVDTTPCDDIPTGGKSPLKLGNGPAIKIKDGSIMCHPYIKNLLINSAESLKINHQYEVLDKGNTDAGAIHTTGVGVITGAISVPLRYNHTACEMASKSDIDNCIKILTKVCEELFVWKLFYKRSLIFALK